MILKPFKSKDIHYIFAHDLGESLLGKMVGFQRENDENYLATMNISSYSDLMNSVALVNIDRNHSSRRRECYLKAMLGEVPYPFLDADVQELLSDSYGMLIYQEDVANIIRFYTHWDYQKCDKARRILGKKNHSDSLFSELSKTLPKNVFDLLVRETPFTWCKAHLLSEREITRKTIVLRELHRDIYIDEIKKFESKTGVSWADIGFQTKNISNLC